MALAEFNKDNPMVMIMNKRLVYLDKLALENMKKCLFNLAVSITCGAGYAFVRNIDLCILFFTFAFIMNYFNFFMYIRTKKKSKFKEAFDIIAGDEYAQIFVNNEKILFIIENQNRAIGVFVAMQSVFRIELIWLIASCTAILLR